MTMLLMLTTLTLDAKRVAYTDSWRQYKRLPTCQDENLECSTQPVATYELKLSSKARHIDRNKILSRRYMCNQSEVPRRDEAAYRC